MHENLTGQNKRGARFWAGQLGAPSSALLGTLTVLAIGALLAANLPTQVIPTLDSATASATSVALHPEDVRLPQTIKVAAANQSGSPDLWE